MNPELHERLGQAQVILSKAQRQASGEGVNTVKWEGGEEMGRKEDGTEGAS